MSTPISRRLLLQSAFAASAFGSTHARAASGEDKKAPDTMDLARLELSTIALPIVQDGRLTNYVFGAIQIQVSDIRSADALRAQSFLLRDAIVRIGSRQPVAALPKPDNFDRVDVTRIVLKAVQSVRPGTKVTKVTFLNAALMRP
jgi:flagellar basal body-associated protein FliL